MLPQVEQYIDTHKMLPPGSAVLVGVSGGVDSMVLVHVLQQLGYQVFCAHINYKMRGDDSDGDQLLVEDYCRKYDISCHIHIVDEAFLVAAQSGNFQEKARDERYQFFQSVAEKNNLPFVAVGQHQDDQVETVLMRLMRGSGIEGLAGMAPSRQLHSESDVALIRPLLGITRAQILAYAKAHKIVWREDASNQSDKYLRNRLRKGFLAQLRESHGETAIANIATSADQVRMYVESSFKPALVTKFDTVSTSDQSLDIPRLMKEPVFWQERLILEALARWIPGASKARTYASGVRELIDRQPGRRFIIGGGTIWRDRNLLRFEASEDQDDENLENSSQLVFPGNHAVAGGMLNVAVKQKNELKTLAVPANELIADAQKLSFPLTLRGWEAGDRFIPFGMNGQKKLSDFLTDIKVPVHLKEQVQVLLSGEEIIWVIGYRASETMRVDEATSEVVHCILHKE